MMSELHTPTQIGQEEQILAEFVYIAEMVKKIIQPLESSKKFEATCFEPTQKIIERENYRGVTTKKSHQTDLGKLVNTLFNNPSCTQYEVSNEPFPTCLRLHGVTFQPSAHYLLYLNTYQWLEENRIHDNRSIKAAEKIRATLRSSPYISCFKTQKRNNGSNLASIKKLIDRAVNGQNGIHAVAIELGYANEFKDGDLTNTVEWSELILHRNALIKKIKLLREVVGYAWKMDTGFRLNKHIHLVLLIDPAMRPQSSILVKEVECIWQSVVSSRKSICVGHPTILSMNGMPYYASKSASTDVENLTTRIQKYLFWKDEILNFQTTAKTKMFSRSGLTH